MVDEDIDGKIITVPQKAVTINNVTMIQNGKSYSVSWYEGKEHFKREIFLTGNESKIIPDNNGGTTLNRIFKLNRFLASAIREGVI